MWQDRSFGVVRALTPDGGDYRGEPLSDPRSWLGAHWRLILAGGSELRVQSRRQNVDFAYLAHHLANLEMTRRGHIWYDYELSRGAAEDLERLASALGQLRSGLAGRTCEMGELETVCMVDLPATSDPDVVCSFLSEARAIQPKDDNVRDAIEYAERLLADLEREQRDAAV